MILLDQSDKRPIYEQITEKLADLMVKGILTENTPLPSVRSLASELSINPNTVQRAYVELERQGYIYSVKGKGSFVAQLADIRKQNSASVRSDLRNAVRKARESGMSSLECTAVILEVYGNAGSGDTMQQGGNHD